MKRYKSSFYKLNLFLGSLLVLSIISLLFRKVIVFSFVFIIFIIVAFYWYRRLGEELIIYKLKQNSGKMKSIDICKEFSKSVSKNLSRLESKGIVQIENGEVNLLNSDYICVFGNTKK